MSRRNITESGPFAIVFWNTDKDMRVGVVPLRDIRPSSSGMPVAEQNECEALYENVYFSCIVVTIDKTGKSAADMNRMITGRARKPYIKLGTDYDAIIKAKRFQAAMEDEASQSSISSTDASLSTTRQLYAASASLIRNEDAAMLPPPLQRVSHQNTISNAAPLPSPTALAAPVVPINQPNTQQFWPLHYGFPSTPFPTEDQIKDLVKQAMEPWISQITQFPQHKEALETLRGSVTAMEKKVQIITEQFQPALNGEVDTPKDILNAMLKQKKLSSAVRVGLRKLFTMEECCALVRTEKGVKMSNGAAAMDSSRLDQLTSLVKEWSEGRKVAFPDQDEVDIHVKRHIDECKKNRKKQK